MRRLGDEIKPILLNYINKYYDLHGSVPSVQGVSDGTGYSAATVHRYLLSMKESGSLDYDGRHGIGTTRMKKEYGHQAMPVLGKVTCVPGDYEEENVLEYIRMPETLVGKGKFFALIAKGNSMVDAGVNEGDYVIVRKQDTANVGDIVVALYNDRLSNLKKLCYDREKEQHYLYFCNADQETYAPIYVDELTIQGVAVSVVHSLVQV